MTSRPKPVAYVIEDGQNASYQVFGQPSQIASVFGPLEPFVEEPELVSVAVRSFARRRYPGGPTSQVRATVRSQFDKLGEGGTNALPGRPFWVETLESATSKTVRSTIQMSTTAPMRVIVATAQQRLGATRQIRTTGGRVFRGEAE